MRGGLELDCGDGLSRSNPPSGSRGGAVGERSGEVVAEGGEAEV